jgi:hypothetical protein
MDEWFWISAIAAGITILIMWITWLKKEGYI